MMGMFELIAKILEILENDLTNGKIEVKSFLIEKDHKKRLVEMENESYFKEYKVSFWKNTFRIKAIPRIKELADNLLLFDRLKELFKDLPIETGIGCGGGLFLFTYNPIDGYERGLRNDMF